MRSVVIGVGQCGGRVADKLVNYDERVHSYDSIQGAVAINTAMKDLRNVEIDTQLIGEDILKGEGVGSDNKTAVDVMERDLDEVLSTVSQKITSRVESIILVAGLGGGTGSGGVPVLADELTGRYEIPVYTLGVLPSDDEGALREQNAGQSLQTLKDTTDATILIDNNIWRETGQSLSEWYDRVNSEIAKRLGLLFRAGNVESANSESVVDSSEIINTLDTDITTAAIGYGETPVGKTETQLINNIKTATRKAINTGLSLSDSLKAETGLLIIAGDPQRISRKGVEKSRQILQDELDTYEVRGGDIPIPGSESIVAMVVVGGVHASPRISSILSQSEKAKDSESDGESKEDQLFQNEDIDGVI